MPFRLTNTATADLTGISAEQIGSLLAATDVAALRIALRNLGGPYCERLFGITPREFNDLANLDLNGYPHALKDSPIIGFALAGDFSTASRGQIAAVIAAANLDAFKDSLNINAIAGAFGFIDNDIPPDETFQILMASLHVQSQLGTALASSVGSGSFAAGEIIARDVGAVIAATNHTVDVAAFKRTLENNDIAKAFGFENAFAARAASNEALNALRQDPHLKTVLGQALASKIVIRPDFTRIAKSQIAAVIAASDTAAFRAALADPETAMAFGFVDAAAAGLASDESLNALRTNNHLKTALGNTLASKVNATNFRADTINAQDLAAVVAATNDAAAFRRALNYDDIARAFGFASAAASQTASLEALDALMRNANVRTDLGTVLATKVNSDFFNNQAITAEHFAIAVTGDTAAFKDLLNTNNELAQSFGFTGAAALVGASDEALAALQADPLLKKALLGMYLQQALMVRTPLAEAAGAVPAAGVASLSPAIVKKIAKAATGEAFSEAVQGIIPREILNQIPSGSIDAANIPLNHIKKAAIKHVLIQSMKEATSGSLVEAIAKAGAAPAGITESEAIRVAIRATHGLNAFDSTLLDDAALLAIRKEAIIKHNEFMLTSFVKRVLNDKVLLQRFIDEPDNNALLTIINENKHKFGVSLCVGDAAGDLTINEVPDSVLVNLKAVAQAKRQLLDNPDAIRDAGALRERLNVAIPEGTDPSNGYTCKHVTTAAELATVENRTIAAAAAPGGVPGAGLAGDPESNRIEKSVNANELTTWSKQAETLDRQNGATGTTNVVLVRKQDGNMHTKNTAQDLSKLTTSEKQKLAMLMAKEYVANLVNENKNVYITCGDPELGKMIYAATLSIQMSAKQAAVNPDTHESIKRFAEVKIIPPIGVKSLHDSMDWSKERYIKKTLGDNQERLNSTMGEPALTSFHISSLKLNEYKKAERNLNQTRGKIAAVDKEISEGGMFKNINKLRNTKVELQELKTKQELDVEAKKQGVLASEEPRENQPHRYNR